MQNRGAIRLHVRALAAWMPGIDDAESWRRWSAGGTPRHRDGTAPDASRIPPLCRRRLNRQGRMAASTVCAVADGSEDAFVFASRHGEVARSTELIEGSLDGETFSPTAFGLSVHNAIGGMLSIATGNRATCIAVSAADQSFVASLFESVSLLADGHRNVLLTCYDEPVPEVYAAAGLEPAIPYAVSMRIGAQGGEALRLFRGADEAATASNTDTSLPQALSFLRFWWSRAAGCLLHGATDPWTLMRESTAP